MKYLFIVMALFALTAQAQQQEEATQAQKEQICKLTMEELAIGGTLDSCVAETTYEIYCGDWCMHNMSNGDIWFASKTLKFHGSVMIDRDDNLDLDKFYVKKSEK